MKRVETAEPWTPQKTTVSAAPATAPSSPSGASAADSAVSEKAASLEPIAPIQRMIFYDGFVKLRSVKPEEIINSAVTLATASGGYVETLKPGLVILRIPAAKFQEIYKAVLKLADVLEKFVSARDITEAFQDVELRLSTAVTARNRIVELLSQSKDEKEKLRLLKEIQRLNEQVETLENLKTMLATMADYSKLTVAVEERKLMAGRADPEELAEFKWISSLSPFMREAPKDSARLNFIVPKDMVVLDRKGLFIAEGADGAVFWSATRDNVPEGDPEFWIEAVKVRLGPEFGSVATQKAGDYSLLRFVENAEKPYVYLIGVKVEKKQLHLLQVYFPSEAHEKRYGESILDSIAKGVQ